MTTLTTRFAPSPTGHLHLGHVASTLYVWSLARTLKAKIILRIEDHDRIRCRQTYEQSILDDLHWLGFHADVGVNDAHQSSPYRQSDHPERYQQAIEFLQRHHHLYYCTCSRKDLLERQGSTPNGEEVPYDGFCRTKNHPPAGNSLRLTMPDQSITFNDLYLGPLTQRPSSQCGDLLLRDRDHQWTYQFCVVVDDWQEGVDLVIRGQDLTASTGRQILLGQMLGRPKPAKFYHHPLIHDATGRKLSKRDFAEAIATQRTQGVNPDIVRGQAAYLVGLQPENRPLTLARLERIVVPHAGT